MSAIFSELRLKETKKFKRDRNLWKIIFRGKKVGEFSLKVHEIQEFLFDFL